MWKYVHPVYCARIQTHNLLELESPPMTTRPGLPSLFNKVWKVLNTEWQIKGNFLQLWVRSCSDPKASIYFAKKYFPRIFFFFFSRSLRRFYFNYFFVIIEFFGNNFRAIESEYEIVLCFKKMGQPRPLIGFSKIRTRTIGVEGDHTDH